MWCYYLRPAQALIFMPITRNGERILPALSTHSFRNRRYAMVNTLGVNEYIPGPLHPFFKEKAILFPVLILTGIGLVMVYSASCSISMDAHNTLFYYLKRQSIFLF